jgi:uncharacterized membrane protein YgdD (TMEM256/DUF423 family)
MAQPLRFAKYWQVTAALSGAAAVGLGAFGSHGLRHVVAPELLQVWRTAVEYQFIHTLAMLVLAVNATSGSWRWVLRLWTLGMLLFSGSLYVLVLTGLRAVAFLTPIGGVALIAGWLVLAWVTWIRRDASSVSEARVSTQDMQ